MKAISCAVHGPLCTKWQIRGVPSVFALPAGVEPVKDNAVPIGKAEVNWETIQERLPTEKVPEEIAREETSNDSEDATIMSKESLLSQDREDTQRELDTPAVETQTDKDYSDDTTDDDRVPGESSTDRTQVSDSDKDTDSKQVFDSDDDPASDEEGIRFDQQIKTLISASEDNPLPRNDDDDSNDVDPPSDDDFQISDSRDVPPPPKAGANLAKNREHEMDKYKDEIKAKIQKQKKKRKNNKRKGNKKDLSDTPVDEEEGATPAMKANKVHTAEFLERKKKYVNYMKRMKAKKKNIAFDSNKVDGNTLGEPAFHKDVTRTKLTERIPIVKRVVRMSSEEALILDCTMAIWHGLTFNAFQKGGPLTPAKQKALTNWLDLLDVALPPEWAVHSLIYDLRQNSAYVSESFENMKVVVDRYKMRRKYFSPTCARKNKDVNGKVGCGYWRLFHVISVGIAEHRGGLNLIDSKIRPLGTKTFSPAEAADTVSDYIAHFFYCDDCARSFLEDYDDCEKNRRCVRLARDKYSASDEDWKEFAMWFWEVHNSLSVELLNEAADAQLKKKQKSLLKRAPAGPGIASPETTIQALWPDMDSCLVCFNIDGTWNEAAVFRHLEETYW